MRTPKFMSKQGIPKEANNSSRPGGKKRKEKKKNTRKEERKEEKAEPHSFIGYILEGSG